MPGPGDKRGAFHRARGAISDTRRAWVKAHYNELILYIYPVKEYPDPTEREHDRHHDVAVIITGTNGKSIKLDLTGYTDDELCAVKEFWDLAFATAQPVCRERDADAAADETGSISRSYRAEPQLVTRWITGAPEILTSWLGSRREWATDSGSMKQLHLEARSRRLPEVSND